MHGQKRRAIRSIENTVTIDGIELQWRLVSEPSLIVGEGLRGVRISVQAAGAKTQELILEYPFPKQRDGTWSFPQRPAVVPKIVEADIRKAIAAGWDPTSRGKALLTRVDEISNLDITKN